MNESLHSISRLLPAVFLIVVSVACSPASRALARPVVEIGSTAEFFGVVPVTLSTSGAEVVSVEHDIDFGLGVQLANCRLGAALFGIAELAVSFRPQGCDGGADCTSLTARVSAIDERIIPDGAELYSCRALSFAEEERQVPLACGGLEVVDRLDGPLEAECEDGAVLVPAAEVHIALGATAIPPAGRGHVDITIELSTAEIEVAGIENRISFGPGIQVDSCEIDDGIVANHGFFWSPSGCVPGVDCESVLALVLDFSSSPRPFPDGAVIYRCGVVAVPAGSSALALPATGAVGTFPLRCSDPGSSAPSGEGLPTSCSDGAVIVAAATPTPTSSTTPTNLATSTEAAGTLTPTADTPVVATSTVMPSPTGSSSVSPTAAEPVDDDGSCAIGSANSHPPRPLPWAGLGLLPMLWLLRRRSLLDGQPLERAVGAPRVE